VKALFVTPVEHGSGETITALHVASSIVDHGGDVRFLASSFAAEFVENRFPHEVQQLTESGPENLKIWRSTVDAFQPDAIVFADYPLLFFTHGVPPLAREDGWVEGLERLDVCLVTLDHTGFAQQPLGLFFGPPHLSLHYEFFPAVPERMHLLLPCPMHEPSRLGWRRGRPFRYWPLPLEVDEERRLEWRRRFQAPGRDLVLFHSVPTWAWMSASVHGLPYFEFLPRILELHLGELAPRVTLVSVNNGEILNEPFDSRLRIVNLPPLPVPDYEALLFSSDLMITENTISISIGKAICGLHPCVGFKNSFTLRELLERLDGPLRDLVLAAEAKRAGAIYRYEVFPSGMTEELELLGLYRDNSLTECFKTIEIFGGEESSTDLQSLLVDPDTREALRDRQRRYVAALSALEDVSQVLQEIVDGNRGSRG
jgi:hypothetical protein